MIKSSVLFLCTGHSRRTQMAEGFLRALAGDEFDVVSAGSEETRPRQGTDLPGLSWSDLASSVGS